MLCELLVFFHRTFRNLGIASPDPRDCYRDERITWARPVEQFQDSVGTIREETLFSAQKAERMGFRHQTAEAIFVESLPEWSQHRGKQRWEMKWDQVLLAVRAPESSCACRPFPVPSSSMKPWVGPFTRAEPAWGHCFSCSPLSPASLFFFLLNDSFPWLYKHAAIFPIFF